MLRPLLIGCLVWVTQLLVLDTNSFRPGTYLASRSLLALCRHVIDVNGQGIFADAREVACQDASVRLLVLPVRYDLETLSCELVRLEKRLKVGLAWVFAREEQLRAPRSVPRRNGWALLSPRLWRSPRPFVIVSGP